MGYRYEIKTQPAPDRHPTPNKYTPHIGKVGLSLHLLQEAFKQKFNWPVVFSRPCIYGTLSRPVGGFAPIKDKCVACHRCVQEYDFVKVDINPKYLKLGDSYFDPESVATIAYEASTGNIPVKGMGYRGKFVGEGFDSFWTDMSEIVRPTRDGIYGREYISTAVDIGRKPSYFQKGDNGSGYVSIPLPILFDCLPPELSTKTVRRSLSAASKELDNFLVLPLKTCLEEGHGGENIIPVIEEEDFPALKDRIREFRIIELRPSGEKPVHSIKTIAEIRRICPTVIIAVRLETKKAKWAFDLDLAREADILHVCADYHGRAWIDGSDVYIKELTESLHEQLVEAGIRDELTLIASGGIIRAEHVPKTIICGADAVAIDTALLVALQSRFSGDCVSGDEGFLQPRKFSPDWGAQRIKNLMASWRNQLLEVVSAMGIRDVRRLRGERGRAIFYEKFIKRIPIFNPDAESR
jgi:hypothetical protein